MATKETQVRATRLEEIQRVCFLLKNLTMISQHVIGVSDRFQSPTIAYFDQTD